MFFVPVLLVLIPGIASEGKYREGSSNSTVCPEGYGKISDASTCEDAAKQLDRNYYGYENTTDYPSGCYAYSDTGAYFNSHHTGQAEYISKPICAKGDSNSTTHELVQFSLMSYDQSSKIPNFNDSHGLLLATYKSITGSNETTTLGTVCSKGFGYVSADVICQNLGYDYSNHLDNNSYIPEEFINSLGLDVALNSFICPESNYTQNITLDECNWNVNNNNSCGDEWNVYISCVKEGPRPTEEPTPEPSPYPTNETSPYPTNETTPYPTDEPSPQPTEESENGIDISFGDLNLNVKLAGGNYSFGWRWPW